MGSPAKSGGQQGPSEGHEELASVSNLDLDKRECTSSSDSAQQSETLHSPLCARRWRVVTHLRLFVVLY